MQEQTKDQEIITVPGTAPVQPQEGTPAAVPGQPASTDSVDDSGHGEAPPKQSGQRSTMPTTNDSGHGDPPPKGSGSLTSDPSTGTQSA